MVIIAVTLVIHNLVISSDVIGLKYFTLVIIHMIISCYVIPSQTIYNINLLIS